MIWQIALTVAILTFIFQEFANNQWAHWYWSSGDKWYEKQKLWEGIRDWTRLVCLAAIVVGMIAFIWSFSP